MYGLYLVRLAVATVISGGCRADDENFTGVYNRPEPHLLLVGDPGTGKSQLLRFVSRIVPRSVLTTGVGSTAAGLTVAAVMVNGNNIIYRTLYLCVLCCRSNRKTNRNTASGNWKVVLW